MKRSRALLWDKKHRTSRLHYDVGRIEAPVRVGQELGFGRAGNHQIGSPREPGDMQCRRQGGGTPFGSVLTSREALSELGLCRLQPVLRVPSDALGDVGGVEPVETGGRLRIARRRPDHHSVEPIGEVAGHREHMSVAVLEVQMQKKG